MDLDPVLKSMPDPKHWIQHWKLMNLVNLSPEDIDFMKAQDLQMTIYQLCIDGHMCTHACYICDALIGFEAGEVRTFEYVRENYPNYVKNGSMKIT